MSRHVTDETLLDVLEGTADAESRRHAEACAACAERVKEARGGLALARATDVPEPSPLYWEAFRRNVGRRIESDSARRSWHWAWLPFAAAAAVLLAALQPRLAPTPAPVLPAWSALPPADQDPGLTVLEGLDIADADLSAVEGERDVVESLADLSDDEVRAFQDALQNREGAL
ncbi:MAG: hypothetical protein ACHQKZ_02040 [Solirubrobacterales bacterium]|jgi:hypothetical protein